MEVKPNNSTNSSQTEVLEHGHKKLVSRVFFYCIFFIVLAAFFIFVKKLTWEGNKATHTLSEFAATLMAFFVAALAFVRFYTKRNNIFLFIGLGFLGTAFLDGYHTVISSEFALFFSSADSLIAWSFTASRIFLSVMMFLSWLGTKREERKGELGKINVSQATILTTFLLIISFLSFVLFPIPRGYYPELFFSRPQELVAGLFFLLALIGYFKAGVLKQAHFNHWLILSLIVGFIAQTVISIRLFDSAFEIVHILKIFSYYLVLTGLLISMYYLFSGAEDSRKQLVIQNMDLLKVKREVEIKTMQLKEQVEEMERKNKQLEDTQKIAFKLVKDVGKAKAETEQEQAKDEALLSSIGEGIIATDKDGNIIKFNKSAGEHLGWEKKEQAVGKSIFAEFPFEYENGKAVSIKSNPIKKALEKGNKIATFDYYVARKDGSRFPVAATITPIELDKVMIGSITVFRDITLEKEIDRAKTEFVSLASHQLRTPLSAITWYAEMLLDEEVGALNEKQRQYLEALYASTERMVELVQAFLNVSRIELGTFAIEPEPTDIPKIIEEVLEDLQKKIKDKSLHIEKKYDSDFPVLNAAPNLITIIFQNLLSNAVKYTEEKGSIKIRLKRRKISVLMYVSDTGYGIPKSQEGKVFSKLFRADNVREKVTDGNGLGLYIVKSIVDKADGKIWFKSEENKGTTFYVSLPLSGMKPKKGTRGLAI